MTLKIRRMLLRYSGNIEGLIFSENQVCMGCLAVNIGRNERISILLCLLACLYGGLRVCVLGGIPLLQRIWLKPEMGLRVICLHLRILC